MRISGYIVNLPLKDYNFRKTIHCIVFKWRILFFQILYLVSWSRPLEMYLVEEPSGQRPYPDSGSCCGGDQDAFRSSISWRMMFFEWHSLSGRRMNRLSVSLNWRFRQLHWRPVWGWSRLLHKCPVTSNTSLIFVRYHQPLLLLFHWWPPEQISSRLPATWRRILFSGSRGSFKKE